MPLVFTAAACHQGQNKPGVAYGYTSCLRAVFAKCAAYIDYRTDKTFDDPIEGSYEMGQNIRRTIDEKKIENPIMLTVGGDHTISFGTLMTSLDFDPDTKLIWIDAHSDINTPKTSLSGNCHGMPVAYITGLAKYKHQTEAGAGAGAEAEAEATLKHLKPANLFYIGLRSIDDAEEVFLADLEKNGMKRYSADHVKKFGIESVIGEISDAMGDKPNIHISLDIDSIDPQYTPATGTPVPGGLTPEDVIRVIKWANSKTQNEKAHLDITEVNPELADLEGAASTYSVVDQIIEAYME